MQCNATEEWWNHDCRRPAPSVTSHRDDTTHFKIAFWSCREIIQIRLVIGLAYREGTLSTVLQMHLIMVVYRENAFCHERPPGQVSGGTISCSFNTSVVGGDCLTPAQCSMNWDIGHIVRANQPWAVRLSVCLSAGQTVSLLQSPEAHLRSFGRVTVLHYGCSLICVSVGERQYIALPAGIITLNITVWRPCTSC